MAEYRRHHVQVLGISTDQNLDETASWAASIGVSFPLLSDADGNVSKKFGLFDAAANSSAKAFAVVHNGNVLHSEQVTETQVPQSCSPASVRTLAIEQKQ